MSRKMIDYNINEEGYIDKIDGRELKGIDQDIPASITLKTVSTMYTDNKIPKGDYVAGTIYEVKLAYISNQLPSTTYPFIYAANSMCLPQTTTNDTDPVFLCFGPSEVPVVGKYYITWRFLCIKSGTITAGTINNYQIDGTITALISA